MSRDIDKEADASFFRWPTPVHHSSQSGNPLAVMDRLGLTRFCSKSQVTSAENVRCLVSQAWPMIPRRFETRQTAAMVS